MVEIGKLATDGVPYKIVKASKGKPTFNSGAQGEYDALILTFEKVRGQNAGERFGKNYTFFENDDGSLAGPGARYLRQAAKAMGVSAVTDTDQLVGLTFVHETVERPNKQGGSPFLDFFPVATYGTKPTTTNGTTTTTATTTGQQNLVNNAARAVRRPPPQ